ncbi:helix-turn-helix domain-containing protein [Streptomyces sp. NPDC058372]|uniref:helix-turn-helix domain-containing protein n=1 Tax=unclassified Streptomyces TaxID=2593676 RepID=UPI00364E919A
MTVAEDEGAEVGRGSDEPAGDEPSSGVVIAFGKQLKLLRERAGLDRTQFGDLVGYAPQSVASFEQGRRIPQPALIKKADHVLDAGGTLLTWEEELAKAHYPPFFRDAAGLERQAVELCSYGMHVLHGLLQTEGYTRAVLEMRRPLLKPETVESRVAARLVRQEIFDRWPAPLLSFVLDEALVHRNYGGAEVKRGQLEHLLLLGRKPNVEIQVFPFDREDNAGVDGPFTLITQKDGRQFVYTEVQDKSHLVTGRQEAQLAAARYGIIRSQALSPRESLVLIEKTLGEL